MDFTLRFRTNAQNDLIIKKLVLQSKYMHKLLQKVAVEAERHEYDSGADYKLAAMIVKGGAIISVGFNKRQTNSFVEHYHTLANGKKDFCLSTHAEMDAVLQVRSKVDLCGSKIYVARIRKNEKIGHLAMAKPCRVCQRVLLSYGIKRAIYTIDDFNYGVLKVSKESICENE